MSTQRQTAPTDDALTAATVADYLRQHPEFFEEHRTLLASMDLPHTAGGGTVSLIERQVATLRQKNLKLDQKLRELLEIARQNDSLSARIHTLTLALVGAPNRSAVLDLVEEHLRTSFAAEYAVLVLFADGEVSFEDVPKRRFLRRFATEADELSPFRTFLEAPRIRCGQIRDAQRDVLFGEDGADIGSAALVPLGRTPMLGFLAIGNRDRDHFHPAISTEFLSRLGDIVSAVLTTPR